MPNPSGMALIAPIFATPVIALTSFQVAREQMFKILSLIHKWNLHACNCSSSNAICSTFR